MTTWHKATMALLLGAVGLLGASGCQKPEGPAEKAGKELDKVTEQVGQQLDKAAQAVRDAGKGDPK